MGQAVAKLIKKIVSKPLSQLSDKQLIISMIQSFVFPLLGKTLSFFKTDLSSFVQGLRTDLLQRF